jgi:hypothetical protein
MEDEEVLTVAGSEGRGATILFTETKRQIVAILAVDALSNPIN